MLRAYNFYEDFKTFLEDAKESQATKRYIVKINGLCVAYIQTGQEYPAFQFSSGETKIIATLEQTGFVIVTQVISSHGGTPTRT